MAKQTIDGFLTLDIRKLAQVQPLAGRKLVRFLRDPEQVGIIKIEMLERERMVLRYKVAQTDGQSEQVADPVGIVYTACAFGGSRRWFLCPGCGRRVAILYCDGHFRCRNCLQLGYPSQQLDACWRGLTQALKRRVKLGGSGSPSDPFPPKPKKMRRETYLRLKEQDDRNMAAALAALKKKRLS
jgi:hypothetical protein